MNASTRGISTGRNAAVSVLIGWATALAAAPDVAWAGDDSAQTIANLIVRLAEHEELVRTVIAQATLERYPTTPAQLARLRQAVGKLGPQHPLERYIYRPDASGANYREEICWWSDGLRARSERRAAADRRESPGGQDDPSPASLLTFDGVLVRSLQPQGAQWTGSIDTAEGGHWQRAHREGCLDFLYQYHGVNYSRRLAEGRAPRICVSKNAPEAERAWVSVEFQDAQSDRVWFVLSATPDGLVRRFDGEMAVGDEPRRLYERWEYFDYEPYLDDSGESIQYPRRVVLRGCLGKLDDGEPVDYFADEFRITQIEFNREIADDTYTLTFPDTAMIWDGVNGYGWVDPARLSDEVLNFQPQATSRWPLMMVWGLVAILTAISGGIFLRWWRRRSGLGAN